MKGLHYTASLAVVILLAAGCGRGDEPPVIDLSKREAMPAAPAAPAAPVSKALRFAVGAMLVPESGFSYYKDLLGFVGEELGRPVRIVDRENYAEINRLLKEGDVDAAFVCSGPYVSGHDEFGLTLLAVPVAYGRPVYYSYIIVHRDSAIEDFEGLRGRSFAFTDPDSNTGRLVPVNLLATLGETPESFFGRFEYTYAHDRSIMAVAEGLVDGAAVDSLIWDYADAKNPEYTSRTKIIWRSAACGIPPVVVRKGIDRKLRERLRAIFLGLDESERGREILSHLMIDRFIPGEDRLYDSIREMKRLQREAGSPGE